MERDRDMQHALETVIAEKLVLVDQHEQDAAALKEALDAAARTSHLQVHYRSTLSTTSHDGLQCYAHVRLARATCP